MDINSIAIPDVIKTYDYESLLQLQIEEVKQLIPDWHPSEGDLMLIEKQASAFREMHLRAEFNELARAFFLTTAKNNDLDNYAVFYGVERLKGSKPTARYRFSLTSKLEYEVLIPKNSILIDDGGVKQGKILEDVVFLVGDEAKEALVELDEYCYTSDVELTTLQTPLPYIYRVEALEEFSNGATEEDDESLRKRILLSLADKSTAGAEMTYKSYAYSADARVKDVAVFNSIEPIENYIDLFENKNRDEIFIALKKVFADFCTTTVVVFAQTDTDNTILDRVYNNVNSEDVRPLTDRVLVKKANEINFDIKADLEILPNYNFNKIYNNALESLKEKLSEIEKIGVDITLSEINDFLRVDGIKKINIIAPINDLIIDRESIAIANTVEISPKVYYEKL